MSRHSPFDRTRLLIGDADLQKLANAGIILFGVGGVGSWCAEALIRSGVCHLTLVDNDVVCVTNINRQMQATAKNVGQPKVLALKERLQEINPDASIHTLQTVYNLHTREGFNFSAYDYVIDAIDSLSHKVDLIATAMESGTTLFSSMGAANKLDATAIRVDSIWKTRGCRLARFVRKRLRHRKVRGDCLCVYSPEQFSAGVPEPEDSDDGSTDTADEFWNSTKAQVNGSMVHVTGAFGFHLAGLVVQDIVSGKSRRK